MERWNDRAGIKAVLAECDFVSAFRTLTQVPTTELAVIIFWDLFIWGKSDKLQRVGREGSMSIGIFWMQRMEMDLGNRSRDVFWGRFWHISEASWAYHMAWAGWNLDGWMDGEALD